MKPEFKEILLLKKLDTLKNKTIADAKNKASIEAEKNYFLC